MSESLNKEELQRQILPTVEVLGANILAQKKSLRLDKRSTEAGDGPTRLPVINSKSTADRMTGRREHEVFMYICLCYVSVGGRGRGSFLLLYKRRQQLLSVVFSRFL